MSLSQRLKHFSLEKEYSAKKGQNISEYSEEGSDLSLTISSGT